MKAKYLSQTDRLLNLFKRRLKHGVWSWEIIDMGILAYTARISDLRRSGYNILNVKKNKYLLIIKKSRRKKCL